MANGRYHVLHENFAREYLVDLDGPRAAVRAGYPPTSAHAQANRLLADPGIVRMIEEERAALIERVHVRQDDVLRMLWQIATADVNELIAVRMLACRHCWGEEHKYQWRDREEYAVALAKLLEAEAKDFPTDDGGYGFDKWAEPHPDCPECGGNGVQFLKVSDTTKLSPAGKLLYAGIKQNRDGSLEIKMRDQDKALDSIARHLGMYPTGGVKVDVNLNQAFVAPSNDFSPLTEDELVKLVELQSKIIDIEPSGKTTV